MGADARPGIVVSIATAGDLLQWHVHLHVLATDGAFSDDATFHPLAAWDAEPLMRLFRERLLARLALKHAISQELVTKLMAWRHPGFIARLRRNRMGRSRASRVESPEFRAVMSRE